MKNVIKQLIKKNKTLSAALRKAEKKLLWYLPRGLAHKIYYESVTGKELNLSDPKDFNEKLQYLAVYKFGKKEAQYADKYLVRQYIEKLGYGDLLPKLFGVYKNSDEIDYNKLPDQFVLKTTHSCGDTIICVNRDVFNINECKNHFNTILKQNYAKVAFEYHYSNIERRIICEEYINDGTGKHPVDYKIYCFSGQPEFVGAFIGRGRNLKRGYYDKNWNFLEYVKKEERDNSGNIDKPVNLSKMLEVAADLSKPFPFVRVDLYNANGKIFFGELTFTPSAGVYTHFTQETLDYLGGLIDLDKY